MRAVSTFGLPLYAARVVVVHVPFAALARTVGKLPRPLPTKLSMWADATAGRFLGGAEHVEGFARPGASVRRFSCMFVDADQTAIEKRLTVVHEAVHLAVRIMDSIEHSTDGTNDEPLAYLTEWITRVSWKACGLR